MNMQVNLEGKKKFSSKAFRGLLEHISEYPMQRAKGNAGQNFYGLEK